MRRGLAARGWLPGMAAAATALRPLTKTWRRDVADELVSITPAPLYSCYVVVM
jgi:hypothetical protein